MVVVKETALVTWECPICFIDNTYYLIEQKPLPDELECAFCSHKSGKIEWTK